MKTFINTFILLLSIIFSLNSCSDINSIHEEYLNRGEHIYLGIVDSLSAAPGDERVKFRWLLNSDPRISNVVCYWNNYADSIIIKVDRGKSGYQWMEQIIELPEDEYVFYFVSKDDNGHTSIPVEISSKVYGESYKESLKSRGVKGYEILDSNKCVITWSSIPSPTLLYSILRYTDYSDYENPIVKEVNVENSSTETILSGIKIGDNIEIVSYYQPENAIDIFTSTIRSITIE